MSLIWQKFIWECVIVCAHVPVQSFAVVFSVDSWACHPSDESFLSKSHFPFPALLTCYMNRQLFTATLNRCLKLKKATLRDKTSKICHSPHLSLPAWPSSLSSCSCRSSASLVISWSLRVELSCSMPPMRRWRSSICLSCCSLLCWTFFRYSLCSDNFCLYWCASAYKNMNTDKKELNHKSQKTHLCLTITQLSGILKSDLSIIGFCVQILFCTMSPKLHI